MFGWVFYLLLCRVGTEGGTFLFSTNAIYGPFTTNVNIRNLRAQHSSVIKDFWCTIDPRSIRVLYTIYKKKDSQKLCEMKHYFTYLYK